MKSFALATTKVLPRITPRPLHTSSLCWLPKHNQSHPLLLVQWLASTQTEQLPFTNWCARGAVLADCTALCLCVLTRRMYWAVGCAVAIQSMLIAAESDLTFALSKDPSYDNGNHHQWTVLVVAARSSLPSAHGCGKCHCHPPAPALYKRGLVYNSLKRHVDAVAGVQAITSL